mmetsp:Transcript_11757/g.20439  ORF Transcript_11757/g.20439 Transcript_11757/m.20439 type:complete len:260 (+) Transcript_11757:467-1246(+)
MVAKEWRRESGWEQIAGALIGWQRGLRTCKKEKLNSSGPSRAGSVKALRRAVHLYEAMRLTGFGTGGWLARLARCGLLGLLGLLRRSLDLGAHLVGRDVAVQLHQLRDVEFGHLQHLHFPDRYILQGVDARAGLFNLLADGVRNELQDQLLQVTRGRLFCHNLHHLLANLTDLGRLGVARLLQLIRPLLGEGDTEQTQHIVVRRLDVHVSFNQSKPLSDKGAELVSGEVHSVEVGEARPTLDILAAKLHLPESLVLIPV